MDLAILKTIVPGALGTVITVVSVIVAIIEKYKADIAIITLAIEKANEDGVVTGEEKKEIADKVYFECIKPKLTGKWYLLRLIPDSWMKSIIGKIVDNICKKAKDLKVVLPAKPA
jgi:hypothetical protein